MLVAACLTQKKVDRAASENDHTLRRRPSTKVMAIILRKTLSAKLMMVAKTALHVSRVADESRGVQSSSRVHSASE